MKRPQSFHLPTLSALVVLAVLASILFALKHGDETKFLRSSLDSILQTGTLVVLTRNTSTTRYEDRDGPAGPEHDLAVSFAGFLGVEVQFVIKDQIEDLHRALEDGEGHLIAAGITRTDQRSEIMRFGPDYQQVQQQVVCRRDKPMPLSPADLVGRSVAAISASSYIETLEQWREGFPDLKWQSTDDHSTEQILFSIHENTVDCTLADSNIVAVNRRYFPELAIAFAAAEEQSLAWIIPRHADKLAGKLTVWMTSLESSGELIGIMDRYYGHVDIFDYVDNRAYLRRINERLPKFRPLFEQEAQQYGFPWTLIAAQAYQESHWDPKAKSPTGVRGLMMLTKNTAKAMGVSNRLNPLQSIKGGVGYLANMLAQMPQTIYAEDRVWFALAAYNVGRGHIMDARALALSLNKDPDAWHSLAEVLPLLSQKRYFRTLKYGYARGTEPVRYVNRIRNYEQILRHALVSTGMNTQQTADSQASL